MTRWPWVAVLGSCTTHQLNSLIELYLCAGRVGAEIYEADYEIYRQELVDPESELYRFQPDFVILASSWRDLGHRPELSDDRAAVKRKVEEELADWMLLWRTAHDRLGCQIIGVRSRQCQGFPRNPGRFHPGSGLSPSLDQLGAIEREASFL